MNKIKRLFRRYFLNSWQKRCLLQGELLELILNCVNREITDKTLNAVRSESCDVFGFIHYYGYGSFKKAMKDILTRNPHYKYSLALAIVSLYDVRFLNDEPYVLSNYDMVINKMKHDNAHYALKFIPQIVVLFDLRGLIDGKYRADYIEKTGNFEAFDISMVKHSLDYFEKCVPHGSMLYLMNMVRCYI